MAHKEDSTQDKGLVMLPYITKTISISINGETAWHSNKLFNMILKVKRFFIKPRYLKNAHVYKKTVDASNYKEIVVE